MDFNDLSTLMREAGIVGCGGAGFPSYAKLNKDVDTIILNCAECEPLLRLHRQLMEKKTLQILQALDFIKTTLGVKNVFIALKRVYTKAIKAIEDNLGQFKDIKVFPLKEVYPAGDEVVLIYEVTGRVVAPGAIPASVKVTVFNVETMYNLFRAMNGIPVTHKYVTVAGEVKNPSTFYAPIGMKITELVSLAGGKTIEDPEYLMGGPMMGRLGSEFECVTKTTNAVILLPKNHYVVQRKKADPKIDLKRAMASCCQCRYCTDMCPRALLGHPIDPADFMRVVSNKDSHTVTPYLNAFYCSGCGLCEMYSCQQGLSPRTLIQAFKSKLKQEGISPKNPDIKNPNPNRDLRRVPVSRLRARLDLEKYNHSAPMSPLEIMTDTVKINLNQHIGAPATLIVKVNDRVKEKDIIAKAKDNALSVNIHSSIDGIVVEANDKYVIIKKEGR